MIAPLVEMLAAIPSVILGFWGVLVLGPVRRSEHLEPFLHDTLGFIPLFGAPQTTGASVFTASLILTIMIIPIIASISRDLFLAVPREMQDGASALGATRWEVVRGVVLPSTASGVVAASLLGLGRALGEAIAVAQVIGAGSEIKASLFETGDTLAARIANQFPGAITELHQSSLFYLRRDPARDRADLEPRRAVDRQALRLPAERSARVSDAAFDPTAPLTADRATCAGGRSSASVAEVGATAAAVLAVAVLGIVVYTVVSRGAERAQPRLHLHRARRPASARRWSAPAMIVADRDRDRDADRSPDRALPDRVRRAGAAARLIRLTLDLMNGLPSIIIGLFIFGLLVDHHKQSGFAASVALAIIMLPLIARGTQEVLLLGPEHPARSRRRARASAAGARS